MRRVDVCSPGSPSGWRSGNPRCPWKPSGRRSEATRSPGSPSGWGSEATRSPGSPSGWASRATHSLLTRFRKLPERCAWPVCTFSYGILDKSVAPGSLPEGIPRQIDWPRVPSGRRPRVTRLAPSPFRKAPPGNLVASEPLPEGVAGQLGCRRVPSGKRPGATRLPPAPSQMVSTGNPVALDPSPARLDRPLVAFRTHGPSVREAMRCLHAPSDMGSRATCLPARSHAPAPERLTRGASSSGRARCGPMAFCDDRC